MPNIHNIITIHTFAANNRQDMKIAVNCWILRNKQLDGIGNFTVETISRIIRQNPNDTFLIMCDKKYSEKYFDFPNVELHKVFPALRHPVLYFFYMETSVKRFLAIHKPDVFLSMDGFLSLSSTAKQIPVIYDLNFEHYPKDLKWRNRFYYRTFFKKFAHKASRIATISEYSKQDIINLYGVDESKIVNVSCGIKEKFRPLSESEILSTREKVSEGKPYFFFIGSMHPRKNIIRLVQAFDLFKEKYKTNVKLVLAGPIWDNNEIQPFLKEIKNIKDIIFTGRISDDELKMQLGSAMALSFMPTFEGFGLPIVEAFQAEVPVLCSNVTSMPEVAGDAALLADPFNINDISEKMFKIYSDDTLKRELIEKGKERKKIFSWDRTAELLYEVVKSVA